MPAKKAKKTAQKKAATTGEKPVKKQKRRGPPLGSQNYHKMTDEMKNVAIRAALNGYTQKETCVLIGCTEQAFCYAKRHDEDFTERLHLAKQESDLEVVNALRKRAIGFREMIEKPFVVSDGMDAGSHVEKVSYEEYYPPHVGAATTWLTNRDPAKWKNKQNIDIQGIVEKMSDEELEAAVKSIIDKETTDE